MSTGARPSSGPSAAPLQQALAETEFAAGSMGPKVRAACSFVEETGGLAAIGSISDTPGLVRGEAGTIVTRDANGLEFEAEEGA